MKKLFSLQPLLTTAIITAAVDLAVAYGAPIPPGAKAPIITLITALATALVHQSVSAPATVVEVARQTAESLSGAAAGTVGTVTGKGAAVVNTVVGETGGLVGTLAPQLGEGD
ncbi:MAG: hypothetical protein LC792_04000 [Actinobacteria bacterium]|nr:hypothetical protein [Actinomycetota bacterium]